MQTQERMLKGLLYCWSMSHMLYMNVLCHSSGRLIKTKTFGIRPQNAFIFSTDFDIFQIWVPVRYLRFYVGYYDSLLSNNSRLKLVTFNLQFQWSMITDCHFWLQLRGLIGILQYLSVLLVKLIWTFSAMYHWILHNTGYRFFIQKITQNLLNFKVLMFKKVQIRMKFWKMIAVQ